MIHKKRRLRKIILLTLLAVFLLLTSTHLLINIFQDQLTQYIIHKIKQKSGGRYSIKVDEVDLDFLMRRITITNFTLTPLPNSKTTQSNKSLASIHIEHLKFTGISYWHLLMNKSLRADSITIKKGNLNFFKQQGKSNRLRKSLHIKSVDVELEQLELSLKKNKKHISFEAGRAFCKDLTSFSKDGFYQLKVKNLNFNKPGNTIYLTGIRLIPSYNKYLFSKKKGYQSNRFAMEINSVAIDGLDTDALLNHRRLLGGRMVIQTADLEIFRNLRIKKRKRIKKDIYPLHILQRIKFDITLTEILFQNVSFKYSAHLPETSKPGTIFLTNISGLIANFSNHEKNLKRKKKLKLSLSGKIMGEGLITAAMTVPLTKRPHAFTVKGSVGKMKLGALNSILLNNSIMVNTGLLDKMTFSLKGNPKRIRGEMRLRYRDLKVTLLKKKNHKKRRNFVSFLANWVLRKQNPKPSKPLRIGNIFYRKDSPMPFFTFIWSAVLEGIKSSTGLKKGKSNKGLR